METMTETYVPRLGDRVTADGSPFEESVQGEIYGLDVVSDTYVWVGNTHSNGDSRYAWGSVMECAGRTLAGSVPTGTLGRWYHISDVTPAQPTEAQNATQTGDPLLADLRTIGEHLKATAERHEWCGEYESHLSRLCDALSEEGAEALRSTAQRARSFTVSYTITVEGSNRAEAIANAQREAQSGSGHWGASERESND